MAEEEVEVAPMSTEKEPASAAVPDASVPETTGSRKRKQVQFFAPDDVKKTEKLVIKEGKGTKLGDIPNVAFHFTKVVGRDELLEELHFLLFKRKGSAHMRKKGILGFSGFVYEGSAEDGRAKLAEKLGKWKLEDIHQVMDLMDLARGSGSKEVKIGALLDFLEEPKALKDQDLAEKAAKAKEKAKAKKEKEASKKEKEIAKKEKAAVKEPAKKKAKKETPAKKEKAAAKKDDSSTKKKAKPASKKKAKAAVEEEEPEEAEDEEDSDDELPLAVAAGAPNDEELRKATVAILKTVQLEDFTMKNLLSRLEKEYGMPFKKRKELLREVINTYVAERKAASAEEKPQPEQDAEPEEATAGEEDAAEPMEQDAGGEAPEEAQEAAQEPAADADEKPAEQATGDEAAEPKPAAGDASAPAAEPAE